MLDLAACLANEDKIIANFERKRQLRVNLHNVVVLGNLLWPRAQMRPLTERSEG